MQTTAGLLLVFSHFAAVAQPPRVDRCQLKVYVDKDGHIFDSRFAGKYRVLEKTLLQDVIGGCKEAGPTSSVTLQPDKGASAQFVEHLRATIKAKLPDGTKVTVLPPSQR